MSKHTGRRTILTIEMKEQIFKYMSAGMSKKAACAAVGISDTTLCGWVVKGEKAIEVERETGVIPEGQACYIEFANGIKKAEADFRAYHLANIKSQSRRDWKASAWMLERCFPDEYGRKFHEIELSGKKDGEPIKVESAIQVYLPDNGRDKKRG